jgi:lysophospholipase L1-like esterase
VRFVEVTALAAASLAVSAFAWAQPPDEPGIVPASTVPATAAPSATPGVVRRAVPLVHPEALGAFREALRALARGERRRVHVMHYGDSNVAADFWSKVVRDALKARFGDGGPGYVVPSPWGSRTDPRLRFRGGRGWEPRRLGFARDFGPRDGLWGLAGVAAAGRAGARLALTIPATEARGTLEVDALAEPGGGVLRVAYGGQTVDLALAAPRPGLVRHRIALDGARGELHLTVVRGEARLLGVSMELDRPGVVYDVLGINGHRVSAWNVWNTELLAAQLEGHAPDLLLLSYGGNEAMDPELTFERYERDLRQAIARAKALAPGASILLVGPVARCPRSERSAAIDLIQRRVAGEVGAAFFETMEVSGGPGSLCPWVEARPALVSRDGLHLSRLGYQILGEELAASLLAAIDARR